MEIASPQRHITIWTTQRGLSMLINLDPTAVLAHHHDIALHHVTWAPHHLARQQTLRHQNTWLQSTSHHHRVTAESFCTAKEWFGHGAGRSPCAHSTGKFLATNFFLSETSAPDWPGTTFTFNIWTVVIFFLYPRCYNLVFFCYA